MKMGWTVKDALSFVKYYYKEPQKCAELILKSDVVIFGGTDDESYIKPRLKAGKPVIRCSERLYREAQWKAVSPRGLVKKYLDHTRYRKEKVYLLCAGGYVPDDFHIVRAYPGKMYRWGYFPETRRYDIAALMSGKGYTGNGALTEGEKRPLYLLWVGRFMTLKHPELAIHAAGYLKGLGISFHLDMVGGGAMEEVLKKMIREKGLEKEVTLTGYKKPEEVRERMEKADILLVTSDRGEGLGSCDQRGHEQRLCGHCRPYDGSCSFPDQAQGERPDLRGWQLSADVPSDSRNGGKRAGKKASWCQCLQDHHPGMECRKRRRKTGGVDPQPGTCGREGYSFCPRRKGSKI